MPVLTKIVTPQLCQIDCFRHVNHLAVPTWFELGREPLYRIFAPEMQFEKLTLIMAHIDVDFIKQMYLGTDIEIRTCVEEVRNTSFYVEQEAWQNSALCATGHAVLVNFDFKTQKSIKISDLLRKKLLEYTA